MALLAVDIVLMPPPSIRELAIRLSEKLGEDRKIYLNDTDCRPHITLAQGCINETDIGRAEHLLYRLSREYADIENLATRITRIQNGLTFIDVRRSASLGAMHRTVMKDFDTILAYDAEKEMFAGKENEQVSVDWLRYFKANGSEDNYRPHITIGFDANNVLDPDNETTSKSFPRKFLPESIDLCHLGNYCTYAKRLASVPFSR